MDFYGTLGPSCCLHPVLVRMYEAGMTGVRLNLSHGMLKERANWLYVAVSAAKSVGVETKILIDLQGPELRVGNFGGERKLKKDTDVIFGQRGIPVPSILMAQVKKGMRLLLDDGKMEAEVLECSGNQMVAKVLRGGVLKPRKSIAVPGKIIETPALTSQDLENLKIARHYGVTGVMLPFVRSEEDLKCLRRALEENHGEDIKIFAKIENMQGVESLAAFMPLADEIVIARGDLGNAVPLWELPAVQKHIGEQCRRAGKPFMVVTQMLDSMEHRPVPTRAEVSDIYNAALEGASSLMLTGETAVGEYPAEAMFYLVQTAKNCLEKSFIGKN